MPRPTKNNADYFSHDAGMRNDERMKAVRKKFKSAGYAIYNMTLEYLTNKDHFVVEYTDMTFELMSGDFDEDSETIKGVIEYCIMLDLFQRTDGFLRCKTLEKRLEPVLLKRKLHKERVSATETTQSKVKESKVKESKVKESNDMAATDVATIEQRRNDFKLKIEEFTQYPKEMLWRFYDYWTEMNDGGRKMRFEMQKVFDVKRRLNTWATNDKEKFNGTINTNKTTSSDARPKEFSGADYSTGLRKRSPNP